MPLVKVLKCVVAEKFSRRVRSNGEVVVNGVVMDAVGPSRGGDRAPGAGAGESSGASSSPKPKGDFLQLFVNEDIKDEKLRESILSLAPKTRIIITEVMKYESSCRLTPKSKMMTKVSAFSYAREDLDEYVKPPLVSVAEAKGSPKKRRLSLEAKSKVDSVLTVGLINPNVLLEVLYQEVHRRGRDPE